MTDTLESINPDNNAIIERYRIHDNGEIDSRLGRCLSAQQSWRRISIEDRCDALRQLAEALEADKAKLARLMTLEMGKPVSQARGEVEKCIWVCNYYADNAPTFLAPEAIDTDAKRSEVVFNPLGVVLAIMPWNFPLWQVFRFVVPALAAGNGAVVKHAANVTGCSLAIEKLMQDVFPDGLFRALVVDSDAMNRIILDPRIAAVTFTGSTGAGRQVAKTAGGALKKTVLELGGSDPYVVLADADIEEAARTCAAARIVNGGQSCIAAKRFIVEASVCDAFIDAFRESFAKLKMGDPMDEDTDVGPMARPDLAETLVRQVDDSLKAGAELVVPDSVEVDGNYVTPMIMKNVTGAMPAFREELFGPVAPIIRAGGQEEALALANDSEFGLGGAIFSGDGDTAWSLAADSLETGFVAVNGQVQSDPRLPFGGIRNSGYGRELGQFGIREFVNIKTVLQAS